MTHTCPHCKQTFEVSAPKQSRPKEGTLTGKVWTVCEDLTTQLGRKPTRKEVEVAATQIGLNLNTIHTQFQAWSKTQKVPEVKVDPAPAQA